MATHREVKTGGKAHRRRCIGDQIQLELHLNHDTIRRSGDLQQWQRELTVGNGAQLDVDLEQSFKAVQCETQPAVVPATVALVCKVKGRRLRGARAAFTVKSDRDIALKARGYKLSADRWCPVFTISEVSMVGAMGLVAYVWCSIENWARTPSLLTKAFESSVSTAFSNFSKSPWRSPISWLASPSIEPKFMATMHVTLRVRIARLNAWPQDDSILIIGGTESGNKRMISRSGNRMAIINGCRKTKIDKRSARLTVELFCWTFSV